MKKVLLLLILLPTFAKGQIVYPYEKAIDSVTLTFFNGDPLVRYVSGTIISIDTTFDTSSTILWQIGNTLKHTFSNDTIASRGIMTDTLNHYPRNANNFFVLKMKPAVSNFIVDFWHKYETDSFHAGGIVEYSTDTGATWMNVVNCSYIHTQNFYLPTNTIISGDPAFTGTSTREQLSRFQFINCWAFKTTTTHCDMLDNYGDRNPIYFRFRFVSDSTIDSLSGWIIDSIKIEDPGCFPPGAVREVKQQSAFDLYPNPTTTSLTIVASAKIEQVIISDILGQTVFSYNYKTEEVQIDVSDLPSGVYFVKVNGSEVRKFVKE